MFAPSSVRTDALRLFRRAGAAPGGTAPARPERGRVAGRWRRTLPWAVLVLLLAVVQTLLVWLTHRYEQLRLEESVQRLAGTVTAKLRRDALDNTLALDELTWRSHEEPEWSAVAQQLLRTRRPLLRIERRDAELRLLKAFDSSFESPLRMEEAGPENAEACRTAAFRKQPVYSRHHALAEADGHGVEVLSLCLPVRRTGGQGDGFVVAMLKVRAMLAQAAGPDISRRAEVAMLDTGGQQLDRVGEISASGVHVATRPVVLPGTTLQLRVDTGTPRPALIPSLAVGFMLGLSLAVAGIVTLLVFDVRRRSAAERALAESLAFRKSMEESMVTGLLVRGLDGVIDFVNPAFCDMVGFAPEAILGQARPPYWPAGLADEYERRRRARTEAAREDAAAAGTPREGFETVFVRADGSRMPVRVFETPLLDASRRHTGWMSTVLDLSTQRHLEELARQQQERLQATARLATVGEMASLLSHELNQPLCAISSYANGSLNLMADETGSEKFALVREGARQIAEEADRAGRVIRSVHDFVRRRNRAVEAVRCRSIVEAVLPLIELQSAKSETQVVLEMQPDNLEVLCDRTMVEQVLINLARNGLQAIEEAASPGARVLVLRVGARVQGRVEFCVIDVGAGISPEVETNLFTPFFTTREQGMGLGLSLCRTVVEQHGGRLEFSRVQLPDGRAATAFCFTLPTPAEAKPAAQDALPS